mgnify:CR=1 FL=1
MTPKDYVAFAAIVKRHTILGSHVSDKDSDVHLAVVRCMARDMADTFAADNARFDRARFLKACGVQTDNERLANIIFGEVQS